MNPRIAIPLVLALLAPLGAARGADVSIEVDSREVDVGIPFGLAILLQNLRDPVGYEKPVLPEVPGLRLVSGPSVGTSTTIINGRMEQSVSLRYMLVATKAGQLTIPAFTVTADGQIFTSTPLTLTASEPVAGDRLFVDIVAARTGVYLGEPLEVTLRIWLKPFEDRRHGRLPAGAMWSTIAAGRSTWGDFESVIRTLLSPFGGWRRMPPNHEASRVAGGPVYDVFEVPARLWPDAAGPVELGPVTIFVEYPTAVVRSFFDGVQPTAAEWLVASAEPPAAKVLPLPEGGRPPLFAGAVGQYDIGVTAKPTDVAVGDPITITIAVHDRSPFEAQLELLQPPPIHRLPALDRDFRVPVDPLAGVVEGRTKRFTQTLRARHDGVAQIPPIPFSYFDPLAQSYVTVESDPIPITVTAANSLSMADVVGAAPEGDEATDLTEVPGGILANVSGAELLLADQRFAPSWGHLAAVALPPGLLAVALVARGRVRRLRHDRAWLRRRSAKRNALRRLDEARRFEGVAAAEYVAAALVEYVADRCDAPAGATTRPDVAARLERCSVSALLRSDVEAVLAACEEARFAGMMPDDGGALPERAVQCIRRLERERLE